MALGAQSSAHRRGSRRHRPAKRVGEALDEVGLEHAADRSVGGYSLGMRQRLGLAGALLGRPGILLLDEPANGLDPEGIRWLRGFLRSYADVGNTVLISSHMLAEVQQTVDDVIIIAHGRLRFQGSLHDLRARAGRTVEVSTARPPSCEAGSPRSASKRSAPATTASPSPGRRPRPSERWPRSAGSHSPP